MTIATREDVDAHGNRWEEKVIWTGGDLQNRSAFG